MKETWFDHGCKNLLAKRQLANKKYCQNSSADKWFAFTKSRLKLAVVMKNKQDSFSRKCFLSLSSAKGRCNINNIVRGSILHSGNLTIVPNSFGKFIVESKETAIHLIYFFPYRGHYLEKFTEKAPFSTASKASISFWVISQNDCFNFISDLHPNKPAGPCKVPVWANNDGKQNLVPHLIIIL